MAEAGDHPGGAAWLRMLIAGRRGYGYVNDTTPELSIAVAPDYRGQGIGTRLLARLLQEAAGRYASVPLSVAPGNPAAQLYERLGFVIIDNEGESLTVIRHFNEPG
ncbi:MAG: GNAT family N-acetyltransferase [Candidatus Promineofilum sp.]|nr:GNAT family N-acetyltransferase [Promineifilum sp.]